METTVIDVPAMYGDHHVIEVRRLLLALPGVTDIYASSYLKTVEVAFDSAKTSLETINAALEDAGYLQEVVFSQEIGEAAYGRDGKDTYFRHTAAYAQTGKTVSFAQEVVNAQRPLIPCPGMKITRPVMDE